MWGLELIWFACFSGLYYISCCSCRASEVVISRLVVRGQATVAQQISTYARVSLARHMSTNPFDQCHETEGFSLVFRAGSLFVSQDAPAWISRLVPCLSRKFFQPDFRAGSLFISHTWLAYLACLRCPFWVKFTKVCVHGDIGSELSTGRIYLWGLELIWLV